MTLPPLKLNKMCVIDHRVAMETGETPEPKKRRSENKVPGQYGSELDTVGEKVSSYFSGS